MLKEYRNMSFGIGTKNGQKNGLSMIIDVETFEYAFFPRGGMGFTVGLSDLGERKILRQEGWFPTKNFNNNFFVPGFFIQPGTENLVSIDVKSFEASTKALDFFSNDKFCFTEKDFQPNHYNLVSRKIILDQDLNYVKPQT